ncbi:uncharacterized protein LOC128679281 [Plodia interpunctella]|uniref:uncharacterized protein LOC128679281 n=1 Tax=Plodia interpunctella TaxID=58824 RepID=UPI002367D4F5|nr:uncharacterized protein LOC128679281 [Plodia interpunctella]
MAAISAIYIDMTADPAEAIALASPTVGIIWIVYYGLVAIAINICAFMAPSKMRAMFGFMNRIQQINLEINGNNSDQRDKWFVVVVIMDLILHTVLTSYDCSVLFRRDKIRNKIETFIRSLFVSHYLVYYNQIFIIMMFQLHVLALQTALKTINEHLERMFYVIRNKGFQNAEDVDLFKRYEIPFESMVPLKSLNAAIDRISYTAHRLPRRRPIHETLRAITHSYLDICKLIEDVNRTFGTVILVLLLTSLVQLVTMGYYAFMTIYSKRMLKMQLVWCLRHLLTILLLTEPCHWTYQEMMRTRHLTEQLTCGTATVMGPFAAMLNKFFYCLCLNKTSFSPLGVCTLTRSISAAILGSMITYLVIVIQFNLDTDNEG